MNRLVKRRIIVFQKEIFDWYAKNKRDLPWRRTRDPYHILVSEVMLQQTQVARVIPKYEAWLRVFPTVESLAHAKISDVLRLWSGLGYNRRALYLQKTAQELARMSSSRNQGSMDSRFRGNDKKGGDDNIVWPRTVEELQKLPGIGKYTAGAVACFAFDQQIAVVDTNIRKVILIKFYSSTKPEGCMEKFGESSSRLTSFARTIEKETRPEKEVQEVADQLLPKGKAYEWNQALMDYASAMLKKEKIPIPKQSRFHGSKRFYRGKLLRLLLQHGKIPTKTLGKSLKEDFSAEDEAWLAGILRGMEKDDLIVVKKGSVALPRTSRYGTSQNS